MLDFYGDGDVSPVFDPTKEDELFGVFATVYSVLTVTPPPPSPVESEDRFLHSRREDAPCYDGMGST
jgi:hypothetical protein